MPSPVEYPSHHRKIVRLAAVWQKKIKLSLIEKVDSNAEIEDQPPPPHWYPNERVPNGLSASVWAA